MSPDLTPELRLESGRLLLELRAARKLRVAELQGPRALLQAYEAAKPANFENRWFGDEVDVPPEMMAEVAFMNRREFRWACDVPIAAGAAVVISIPNRVAEAPPLDLGIVSVVYEYTRFFGLLRRKFSATVAVGDRKNRVLPREAPDV